MLRAVSRRHADNPTRNTDTSCHSRAARTVTEHAETAKVEVGSNVSKRGGSESHNETPICSRTGPGLTVSSRLDGKSRVTGELSRSVPRGSPRVMPLSWPTLQGRQTARWLSARLVSFLGFTFRPRCARAKDGKMFLSFLPAISGSALKKIGREVRSWRLHRHTRQSFSELAQWVNPIVRGWMRCYGAFYRSALYPLLMCRPFSTPT